MSMSRNQIYPSQSLVQSGTLVNSTIFIVDSDNMPIPFSHQRVADLFVKHVLRILICIWFSIARVSRHFRLSRLDIRDKSLLVIVLISPCQNGGAQVQASFSPSSSFATSFAMFAIYPILLACSAMFVEAQNSTTTTTNPSPSASVANDSGSSWSAAGIVVTVIGTVFLKAHYPL